MPRIQGLYTALITPFNAKGHLDEEGFRRLVRFQVAAEVDGVTVNAITGEGPTLTQQEKKRIITIAKEEIKGRIKLMAATEVSRPCRQLRTHV